MNTKASCSFRKLKFPGTGSVTLRAQFPNPDRKLLPGMFVHALVDSGTRDGVYLLPNQALMLGNGTSTVYVVDQQNKVEARKVVNERMVDSQWMITDGLQAGERVVVEGRQKVRPGAEVEIAETFSAAQQEQTPAAIDEPTVADTPPTADSSAAK